MTQRHADRDELDGLQAWALSLRRWRLEGAELLAAYRLTWNSFEALLELRAGPKRSGELSRDLGMTTGGMAKLLSRLEELNTIKRQRGEHVDLRVVSVELTEEGLRVVSAAGGEILHMLRVHLDETGATEGEKDAFRDLWWRLAWVLPDEPEDE
jgi:DNA-binding MarR family transcriptional regulator